MLFVEVKEVEKCELVVAVGCLGLDSVKKLYWKCRKLFTFVCTDQSFADDMKEEQTRIANTGTFSVVESFLKGKHSEADNEDALFVGPAFAAVIDGATSKSDFRKDGMTTGQWAVQCVMEALQVLPADATCAEAVAAVTERIHTFYETNQLLEQVISIPACRCTASAVIYSVCRKEVWQVGDCRCLTHSFYSANEKEVDRVMAEARVACNEAALASGMTIDELAACDPGRAFILPFLKQQAWLQNRTDARYAYAVFDGFQVPMQQVKCFSVADETEIVLASDGYPKLFFTLDETEAYLHRVLEKDPMCMYLHPETKGMLPGNCSYDDRAYLRLRIG